MNKVRANQIAAKALQTRRNYLYVAPNVPICPFNLAEAMGFDVRFVDIPSLEGMYLADDLTILIGSLRPEGRKNFTCAHEIGHHILGHGTAIDEILNALPDKTIEQEADFFAAMLLMPLSAVRKLSCEIVLDFDNPSETKIYFVSQMPWCFLPCSRYSVVSGPQPNQLPGLYEIKAGDCIFNKGTYSRVQSFR